MLKTFPALLCFLVFWSFCGCSGEKRPKDMPALRTVTLMFTQEGKPLDNASVILIPEEADGKWGASAMTNEKGEATLRTWGQYSGVPEGKYKVVVSKMLVDLSKYPGTPPREMNQKRWHTICSGLHGFDTRQTVDAQYRNKETTPLLVEVGRGGIRDTLDVGKEARDVTLGVKALGPGEKGPAAKRLDEIKKREAIAQAD